MTMSTVWSTKVCTNGLRCKLYVEHKERWRERAMKTRKATINQDTHTHTLETYSFLLFSMFQCSFLFVSFRFVCMFAFDLYVCVCAIHKCVYQCPRQWDTHCIGNGKANITGCVDVYVFSFESQCRPTFPFPLPPFHRPNMLYHYLTCPILFINICPFIRLLKFRFCASSFLFLLLYMRVCVFASMTPSQLPSFRSIWTIRHHQQQ